MNSISFIKFHHENQTRATGESYVFHPIRVGRALEDFGLDQKYVTAAMLHDVLEMTNCRKKDIEHIFGADITEMVDCLSKHPKSHYITKHDVKNPKISDQESFNNHPLLYSERAHDYLEKIEHGAKKYPEILIIKMCDQLDNLKDCSVFSMKKMTRIVEVMTLLYIPLYKRCRVLVPEEIKDVYDLLFERFLERLEIVRSDMLENSV